MEKYNRGLTILLITGVATIICFATVSSVGSSRLAREWLEKLSLSSDANTMEIIGNSIILLVAIASFLLLIDAFRRLNGIKQEGQELAIKTVAMVTISYGIEFIALITAVAMKSGQNKK